MTRFEERDGRITEQPWLGKIEERDPYGSASVMMAIEGTRTLISAAGAKRVETRHNDSGQPVEVKIFNADAALICRVEITRDEKGNPIEETQYVGDVAPFGPCPSGSCPTEESAAFTEEQTTEFAATIARLFSPDTSMSKHTHRYDPEGRLVESKLMMMGLHAGHQTFAYDDFGNKNEEVSYTEDEKIAGKAVFTREYDDRGNWTKELVSTVSSWEAEFGLSTPAHVNRRAITYW